MPRMAEYEFTSEGSVKETQRFAGRYHAVLLYLTTHLPGSKCKSKRKTMANANARKAKKSIFSYLYIGVREPILPDG